MAVHLGVNGLGRIGKLYLNQLLELYDEMGIEIPVTAVNDVISIDEIVSSFKKRDQTHGDLGWDVEKGEGNQIRINGRKIRVFQERDMSKIPWGDYGVKVVAECSGIVEYKEQAERHIKIDGSRISNGAERVIISAPAENVDKTLAMGVNHTEYDSKIHYIVSNASCTTKALAMPLKALIDAGIYINAVLMDTTHAATNSQRVLQVGDKYGVLDEIQTAKTGAAIATSELIPMLEGKMDGYALRVPTKDGSFANIYFVAGSDSAEKLSVESINRILKDASEDKRTLGRLGYFEGEEAGSTDIVGNTASAIIIASKTKSIRLPRGGMALVGICSGYDNELGPSRDLAILSKYILEDTYLKSEGGI